jgi:hypothetical protein
LRSPGCGSRTLDSGRSRYADLPRPLCNGAHSLKERLARTVNEAEKVAILHIDASTFPNQVGTDQKRTITSLTAAELKYNIPAATSGVQVHQVWKRAE